jgi:hypothetical protein
MDFKPIVGNWRIEVYHPGLSPFLAKQKVDVRALRDVAASYELVWGCSVNADSCERASAQDGSPKLVHWSTATVTPDTAAKEAIA